MWVGFKTSRAVIASFSVNRDKKRTFMTPESSLKKAIRVYLNLRGIFYFHNFGALGAYKGIADITILHEGKSYWVECKSKTGIVSPYQKKFLENVERAGCIAVVAREPEDVMKLFDKKFPRLRIEI